MKIKKNFYLPVVLLLLVLLTFSCNSKKQANNPETQLPPLERLIEGNKRFSENKAIHPDQTLERLKSLEKSQHPFAVVITCADSRVSPELVFDEGLGDLFVIRNAGNIISDYELGSIEYAVEHLNTKLVVVLGHTSCGAVGAFIDHKKDTIDNHIQKIIDYIKLEPEENDLEENATNYYEKAILANVAHGVHVIEESEPVMKEFIHEKKVNVVGMVYNLETGKTTILNNEK